MKNLKYAPILLFFLSIYSIPSTPSANAIEIIKCFSDVQRVITPERRITFPPISLKRCVCTDKGVYCSYDGTPIQDTNIRANCKELKGDEIKGGYCGIKSEDKTNIILFKKEREVLIK
jgi:hypothetical protein